MKQHCLLPALAMLLALSACAGAGSSSSAPSSDAFLPEPEAVEAPAAAFDAPEGGPLDLSSAANAGASRVYSDENAKLIRRAGIELQTTDFAAAEAALDALVAEQEGYYESAQVQGGGYYDPYNYRYGSYVVRVPSGRYSSFLEAVGTVGHVVRLEQSSEDIGEVYFDTESRLQALQIKRERLLALLEQAATMQDIIDLENALSDVEYQIEQYSTELRRYDGLVDYATITLSLDEVRRVEGGAGEKDTLGVRLAAAFSEGLTGFGESLGNFAVWCAYHFLLLVICIAAAAFAAVRLVRWRKKRAAAAAFPPADPPDKTA